MFKELRIVVVLPAYNEENTISQVIESFYKVIPEAEIWIINNRSEDSTEIIAKEALLRLNCKGGIINEYRQGKGNAVQRAFNDLDADIYILADADMTYPADQVRILMAPILSNDFDMVVGDRQSSGSYASENKRPLHNLGNLLVRNLVNTLFNANLIDIMSGYRIFNRRFVKNYPILVEGFEIETDMTLHALDKNFRILEIPISYRDRPRGSFSKLNTFSDGSRVIYTIGKILRYYRPLLFFGVASLFFLVLGLISAIPVFEDWVKERYINHLPLAILAVGLEIVSIILFAIALILDSAAYHQKKIFAKDLLQQKTEII